MIDLGKLKESFADCACGKEHTLGIREILVGGGVRHKTARALKDNGFEKNLLFVADENTLKASENVISELGDFKITAEIYDDLKEATVKGVKRIEELLKNVDGVISVGTGSLNDICRMAAANLNKPICIFATAPSMDGFASYNAPLTDGNFKITYAAKSPELIIGDTEILARAPAELKSAGFGDMVGKYIGLIDWQTSALITGEYYCEKVAALTRAATDRIMEIADRVTACDEESAEAVMESLLLTGIGMSFTKTSRPASGTEHILSHFWECKKLLLGKRSDFHGKKVGVATLLIAETYAKLYNLKTVRCKKETPNWEEIYAVYGALSDEVRKLNTPDTITDGIDPKTIEENWGKIRDIIASVPSGKEIKEAMIKAGCATTTDEIAVSDKLREEGLKYHPFMRRRLSLYRLKNMIEF